jgi:hypothetical protein
MSERKPCCPVHLGTVMRLVAVPHRRLTLKGWKLLGVRPMWRCAVDGCARVELWQGDRGPKIDLKHNYGAPISLWRWREIVKQESVGSVS